MRRAGNDRFAGPGVDREVQRADQPARGWALFSLNLATRQFGMLVEAISIRR